MDRWSRELVLADDMGSVPSTHSAPRDPGLSDLCRYQEYIQCLIYSVPYIFRHKIHTYKNNKSLKNRKDFKKSLNERKRKKSLM